LRHLKKLELQDRRYWMVAFVPLTQITLGKGRPYKIYSLKVGFNDIIAQLEKQPKKAVEETQARIERLKEMGKY